MRSRFLLSGYISIDPPLEFRYKPVFRPTSGLPTILKVCSRIER